MSKHKGNAIIKIITDEPTLEDALDFDSYSQQLADIIVNSTPRFTIGVFGGWGTGKTTLMKMIEKKLKDNNSNDILVVWFDAWKYEKEKYLAVVPFIRTIKIALENNSNSKIGRWDKVRKGLENTFTAFINSTNINFGLGSYGSTQINLSKFMDTLKADGSVMVDGERIQYHSHVTDYLVDALAKLRAENPNSKIVAFIDDLDRCTPENALEVLESIKTFFDIEGFVYVIGMDSDSINSIVRKKYGDDFSKGLDYMQKIVQLPFQVPTWKEVDISKSISKIIAKGLEGSELVEQFERNKELIVKAVQLNPREVKRFINNVILAKLVLGKPIDELIAVQALNFHRDWNKFLELITPDETRWNFLREYKRLKKEGRNINNEELDKLTRETSLTPIVIQDKNIIEICRELVKHGNALTSFLDAGAVEILLHIEKMEEHRRALDATKLKPMKEEGKQQDDKESERLLKLLHEGKVQDFNEIRAKSGYMSLSFSSADLSGADLCHVDLRGTNLSHANLTRAKLKDADLSGAKLTGAKLVDADLKGALLTVANLSDAKLVDADLTRANLVDADFTGAKLVDADLSHAHLRSAKLVDADLTRAKFKDAELQFSILISCRGYHYNLICKDADFSNAIIDDKELENYLRRNGASNVPPAANNKNELRNKLEERGVEKQEIEAYSLLSQ